MTTFEQWEQYIAQLMDAEREVLGQLELVVAKDILRRTGLTDAEDYPFVTKPQLEHLTFLRDSVEVVFRPQGQLSRQEQRRVLFPYDTSISSYIGEFVKFAVKRHPDVAFLVTGEVSDAVRDELKELKRLINKYPKRAQLWLEN